jgi:hypothetical protein
VADKYKIIEDATYGIFDERELGITGLDNGIDEYMKQTVIEAFEFIAKNTTGHSIDEKGNVEFKYKGEWINKEELFEYFL